MRTVSARLLSDKIASAGDDFVANPAGVICVPNALGHQLDNAQRGENKPIPIRDMSWRVRNWLSRERCWQFQEMRAVCMSTILMQIRKQVK
ncbi:hypothetical protein AQ436_14995 [Arthrobacter sp. EpRS66]|nr:hypothetical protein AQ436_14995 [Arthrobacter sp. EpRS66]